MLLNSEALAHFLCLDSMIVSLLQDHANLATSVYPSWTLRLHLYSRRLESRSLVQEVSP